MSGWQRATVVGARAETASARTLRLQVEGWPGHLPGQHVDVRLTAPDGYTATRSYSIASAFDGAAGGDEIEISVEEVADGEVSPYLVQVAAVGDAVEVRGPLGGWFVWRAAQPEPLQLIGGGSGVVPLMSMVRGHELAGARAPVRLLYSVRDPASVYYRDELTRRAAEQPGLQVDFAYTRTAPPSWDGVVGRLDGARLSRWTWPVDAEPTTYVCGPTGFVEAVADELVRAGYDPRRIRTERFGPSGS
ncbi:ferredoxin reductase [Angustibacter luteus]|uniref:Ferredoxin reductase n=1 Tax=Angustibacter luteus TaxID=658456 RepID=A0ABW1JFS6_9ACTN